MQDASHRRVKRIYWGIRVLPVGVLNLDYDSSAEQWNATEGQGPRGPDGSGRHVLLYTVRLGFASGAPLICGTSVMLGLFTPQLLTGLGLSAVGAGLILLGFHFLEKRERLPSEFGGGGDW